MNIRFTPLGQAGDLCIPAAGSWAQAVPIDYDHEQPRDPEITIHWGDRSARCKATLGQFAHAHALALRMGEPVTIETPTPYARTTRKH